MADAAKPTYLVDVESDPIVIRIEGRASFQNSACLHDFFQQMRAQGRKNFVMDFLNCTSMDSTFLGVLAGAALDLRKSNPQGSLVLSRLGERNHELVRNLGLHRLLTIDTGQPVVALDHRGGQALPSTPPASELENARLVLAAHENLVRADEGNREKFQDVLTFLKQRVDQGDA